MNFAKSLLILTFLTLNFFLYAEEADPLLNKKCVASFEKFLSKEEINQKMDLAAQQLDCDFQGEEITLIMIMKGAICVGADLMRHLHSSCVLEYIQTSSYGANGMQRGELKLIGLERLHLEGKNVLVVDDVFDSGVTLSTIVEKIKEHHPKTVRSLVLLSKNIPHKVNYKPDYVLFDIEDRFVVGYGMDYKEHYRELPDIYAVQ